MDLMLYLFGSYIQTKHHQSYHLVLMFLKNHLILMSHLNLKFRLFLKSRLFLKNLNYLKSLSYLKYH